MRVLASRRIAFRTQSLLREGELGFYPTTEPVICDLGLINIAVRIIVMFRKTWNV